MPGKESSNDSRQNLFSFLPHTLGYNEVKLDVICTLHKWGADYVPPYILYNLIVTQLTESSEDGNYSTYIICRVHQQLYGWGSRRSRRARPDTLRKRKRIENDRHSVVGATHRPCLSVLVLHTINHYYSYPTVRFDVAAVFGQTPNIYGRRLTSWKPEGKECAKHPYICQ